MAVPARSGTSPTDAIQEMADALSHEIAATRRRGASWRRIGAGKRLASGPTGALYEFAVAGGGSARPGWSVQLRIGGDAISASVVRDADDSLWLRLPQDLGPEVGPARMRQDAAWMLIEQRQQLLGFRGHLPRLAALLLRLAEARTKLASAKQPPGRVTSGLNREQAEAVTRALDSELSYVWGPPGTGKTLTVARIAEASFREGRSVLVAAPTNQAVEHLLSAVLERLKAEKEVAEHAVLRLGPIVCAELDRRWGHLVDLDRAAGMAVEGSRRAAHMDAMTDVLARLDGEEADADEAAVVQRLRTMLARDLTQLKARRAAAWPAAEAERERLLHGARLVATTLHRASLPGQLRRDFDVLIVDEANAAQFPTVLLAAARARKRVVIAGDFRQLPPVVLSRTTMAKKWLGRDAFEIGGVARVAGVTQPHPRLTMLRTQYRMAPAICKLVGDFAYGGRLTTADARVGSSQGFAVGGLLGARPLSLIDTSPMAALLDGQRGLTEKSRRPLRSNPWHRLVIGRLLRDLMGPGRSKSPRPNVAVLTPYRDQVRFLRKAFGQSYGASFLTIHQSLGKEWDVVILDLPEAAGLRPSPFMTATKLSDTGARLLNVGLSRARTRLVVIADCTYYTRMRLGNAIVGRLLDELEERSTCLSVTGLVWAQSGEAAASKLKGMRQS